MPRRRTEEDIRNPHRIFYSMIGDYRDGRLGWQQHFLRARVEGVDGQGGLFETNPPNPRNSIRARIINGGADFTLPREAVTVFYPLNPERPVVQGEHVLVAFEDEQMTSGYWYCVVPSFSDPNYGNPDFRSTDASSNASYAFEGEDPPTTSVNPETEYGGITTSTSGRSEMVDIAESNSETNRWANKKVLHIGDSQTHGPFGLILGRKLTTEKQAASYQRDGRQGWGVIRWLSNSDSDLPALRSVISSADPDIIVINLGGNDGPNSSANRPDYSDKVRELWDIARAGADIVIWCGPATAVGASADIQPSRALAGRKIRAVVGEENYVDVADITNTTIGRDRLGVHYSLRSPAIDPWTDAVIEKLT